MLSAMSAYVSPTIVTLDPARQRAGLHEIDAALAHVDDLLATLSVLRDAAEWESEGVRALRRALDRLTEDSLAARTGLYEARSLAEAA